MIQMKGKRWLVFLAGIILTTILVYGPSLKGTFLSYDDHDNVVNNPLVKQLSAKTFPDFFRTSKLYMYSPLTFISYAVDFKFFGMNPFWFRLVNLLLHLANILLVFLLIRKILQRDPPSLAVAALFALTPVNADTVAWISARSNLIATFFALLSLILYFRYTESNRWYHYVLAVLFFIASVFSKSSMVMMPFTLFVVEYLLQRKPNVRRLLEKIPFFTVSILFGLMALWFRSDAGIVQSRFTYTSADHFFMACYSLTTYIVRAVFPFGLSEIYGFPQKSGDFLPLAFYLSVIPLAGIFVLVFVAKKLRRLLVFGFFFFLLNILITQFTLLEDGFIANRYAYMPLTGIFLMLVVLTDFLLKKHPVKTPFWLIPVVLIFSAWGWTTLGRAKVWKNAATLFDHVIKQSPDAAFAYNNRGIARFNSGQTEEALADYERAVALHPGYSSAYYNKGLANQGLGNYDKAVEDFSKAIDLNPPYASAYTARGIVEMDIFRDLPAALEDFTRAIRINPGFAQAYFNRGIVFLRMGKPHLACPDLKKVRELGFDKADGLIERYCR